MRRVRSDEPVEMRHLDGVGHLPAHGRGGPQHGVHGPQVPGLAVEDARQRVPDLGLARVRRLLEERLRGEDHRRGGVAGLDGAGVDERLLDRVHLAGDAETLDRLDRVPVRLGGEHDIRRHEPAVDEHRRGAGFARVRAVPHAVEAGPPQRGAQGFVRLAGQRAGCSVDGELDRHARSPLPTVASALAVSTSARCAR